MTRGVKIHALCIDPQNSFMGNKDGTPYSVNMGNGLVETATLGVPGAIDDIVRFAKMLDKHGNKIDDVHITLDSHRNFDIAHPSYWRSQDGKQPNPFTIISVADVESGLWTPRVPHLRPWTLTYVKALADTGKYALCIWPPHCLIGSWGHNVHHVLDKALQRWSDKEVAMVNYVTKGSNPYTEHYGALLAEVPDPKDPSTGLNSGLLNVLLDANMILVGGQASSHCVLETLKQIANNIGVEHIKKFYLLKDCMSPVPAIPGVVDFPAIAEAGLKEMERLGMTITNSVDVLA